MQRQEKASGAAALHFLGQLKGSGPNGIKFSRNLLWTRKRDPEKGTRKRDPEKGLN